MKLRALLLGLFLAASTSSALAAGPYVGVGGGVSFFNDSNVEPSNISSFDMEYDTGYGFYASAGYNFVPVRLEFEFGYKKADVDKVSGTTDKPSLSDSDVTVKSYMVNVLYDHTYLNNRITPYIGAGIGLLNADLNINDRGDVVDLEGDDNEFGYQVIIGAAFNMTKSFIIDLSYRFQSAPSDFSKVGADVEYNSSNIMAGLRYNF